MNGRFELFFSLLAAGFLLTAAPAYPQAQFRLKPGAKGKVCLTCHVGFQDKLKSPSVHTPVKTGDCTGCHNPHTSSHGKLLDADITKLCFRCHSAIPKKTMSVHTVVAQGNCILCHDPHASAYRFNLLKRGNDLCFGCHTDLAGRISKAAFRHNPVEKGCLNCHTPHASDKSDALLKEKAPLLCGTCHKTASPVFVKQHMNYPVAKALCTTCHDPHGSNKPGMLYDTVHKPVAAKMCGQCHEEPASQNPFRTKKEGYELCRGCHGSMIAETFEKNRLHWPVVSKGGCLSCHAPHASLEPALMKEPVTRACGACHEDTIERQERARTKHGPVKEGNCALCHAPHSSDNAFLLMQPLLEQCSTCHEWKKHTSHPMGEKARDLRNRNLSVDCLSCHSAHGTDNKHMLYFPVVSELCTQCHVQYRR